LKRLAGVHPAVHGDRLSRDKRVRDERVYDLRDLLWASEPTAAGTRAASCSRDSSSPGSVSPLLIRAGATAFTVTPYSARGPARERVSPMRADFEAV
jgi:hypothetical protein